MALLNQGTQTMAGQYQQLQPFNIPTQVGGTVPIQAPPHPNLTFPVFTPPQANTYGKSEPMPIPWTPPNLAGAINDGMKTGAQLAGDALTGKKTMMEIQNEEQAAKAGIAASNDPNLKQNIGYELTPQGWTMTIKSPMEAQALQLGLAKTQAETEASRAATAKSGAETAAIQTKTPVEVQKTRADIVAELLKTEPVATRMNPKAHAAWMAANGITQADLSSGNTGSTGTTTTDTGGNVGTATANTGSYAMPPNFAGQ